jgi:hypothetical protein
MLFKEWTSNWCGDGMVLRSLKPGSPGARSIQQQAKAAGMPVKDYLKERQFLINELHKLGIKNLSRPASSNSAIWEIIEFRQKTLKNQRRREAKERMHNC